MKTLGLDLGTNSIGWAVVDKDANKILEAGVRIFPEGVVKETIGRGDKEQSKNASRRDMRQMRRHFFRKRLRKIKLLELLSDKKMCPVSIEELRLWKNWDKKKKSQGKKFPESPGFIEWIKLNPYELRKKALSDPLSLYELGRIFYHLIQRRGFLSSRKGQDESTIFTKGKPDENILPINETRREIGHGTLGGYLSSISYQEKNSYRTTRDKHGKEIRVRGRYTVRDMYVREFEAIWNAQAQYHGINDTTVKVLKTRKLKGSLTAKRNKHKIQHLQDKFGKEKVMVSPPDRQGFTIITTSDNISLKEHIAGKIWTEKLDDGEEVLRFRSNESILFWQRPLRSQKNLLANCRFENELPVIKANGEILLKPNGEVQTRSKKPCPLSHPEFELFRAYQFVNNIRYGKGIKLNDDQRKTVIEFLSRQDKSIDFRKIPELLRLTYEKFNYEDGQKISGNPTIKALKPLFEKTIWENYMEEIWHCFYFYSDSDMLFRKLVNSYGYTKGLDDIKKIRLKEGYGGVSLKAIRNILPFLKKGYQYDKAVLLGGIKNVFGSRWAYFFSYQDDIEREMNRILKEDNKEGEAIEKIKEYLASPVNGYGFAKDDPRFLHLYHHSQAIEPFSQLKSVVPTIQNLRNPIVQQGLHEMRRLVNTLIMKYEKEGDPDFHFDQINVEMGRELRNNKQGRQEASFRIRENEKKNEEARNRIAEYGLQPSRDNIQKFLMYREIEEKAGRAQCPYTGKIISIANLLGAENAIQIEHIVPYSICLDDSFGNKTLCEANFNNMKGEKTPFQFYKENPDPVLWGAPSWEAIEERTFRILPYNKAKKFTSKKESNLSDFIDRQLNDTRYIARQAVMLLSEICHDVRVLPGQLTSELRHLWGLNNILQPTFKLEKHDFNIDEEAGIPHYAITDNDGNIMQIIRKQNPRPSTIENEILIPGFIHNGQFSSPCYHCDSTPTGLSNGKYWAKILVSEPIHLVARYIDKPVTGFDEIVFKGKIENGVFSNDTYGKIKSDQPEGGYWAKFRVLATSYIIPEKNKQPKASRHQVLLFGKVQNGLFTSYIYQCETENPDGKYWLILDLDPETVSFIVSENPKPVVSDNQILITGTINESGWFVSDIDQHYQVPTGKKPGKYFMVVEVLLKTPDHVPLENQPPQPDPDSKLIEGTVWVDKYTGEIKFDPKKNRDDHRHHAIDAITIALTEQGYLQRLSTYSAQRKGKQRQQISSSEKFPEPWTGFDLDVKKAVEGILVSHKKNSKTLTKNRKGYCVRGQLHKDFVFGKRTPPGQLSGYHIRKKVTELQDHKHISKIVDPTIRKIIEDYLQTEMNINVNDPKGYKIPKEAFFKNGEWQLFLPNRKGGDPVPIKKVRISENMGNVAQLKSGINQFVNPRNNHHVLIYKDKEGNLKEDVVQFWTVVERKLQGEDAYQLPEDGEYIVTTLEINDMFLLGLTDSEFELNKHDQSFINKYCYRVQKISSSYYTFRYHTASTIEKNDEEIYIRSFKAWENLNPIKIKIDIMGNFPI